MVLREAMPKKQFGLAYGSGILNSKIGIAEGEEKRGEEDERTFVYFPKADIFQRDFGIDEVMLEIKEEI